MPLQVAMPRLLPLTIMAMGGTLLLHGARLAQGWVGAVADDISIVMPAARAESAAPAAGAASHAEVAPAAAGPRPQSPPSPGSPPETTALQPAAPPVGDSERALLQDLRARRGELDGQAASLGEREAILAAAAKRLDARLDELSALQHRLEQMDAARKQRDEANWQGMVKLYETMKPADAATIFNDLDMPVLLQVLDRMKPAKAAVVLGAMQPERARQVTAQLAELRTRRESVPGG